MTQGLEGTGASSGDRRPAGEAPRSIRPGRRARYGLLVLLAGVSYGFVSPVIKLAYRHGFTAREVTEGQFYYALALLWAIALPGAVSLLRNAGKGGASAALGVSPGASWRAPAGNARLAGLLALSGVFAAVTALSYYRSIALLPAWLSIVLLFQYSWVVFIFDYLFMKKKPSAGQVAGIAAIWTGTLLAAYSGGGLAGFSVGGVALGLLSAFSYGAFLYVTGRLPAPEHPLLRSAIVTTFAAAAAAATAVYPPGPGLWDASLRGFWVYGLWVGMLSQVVPTTLFAVGIPRIGGSAAAILSSVELPVAVVLAASVLHESIGFGRWSGVFLILAGVAVGELWKGAPGRA